LEPWYGDLYIVFCIEIWIIWYVYFYINTMVGEGGSTFKTPQWLSWCSASVLLHRLIILYSTRVWRHHEYKTINISCGWHLHNSLPFTKYLFNIGNIIICNKLGLGYLYKCDGMLSFATNFYIFSQSLRIPTRSIFFFAYSKYRYCIYYYWVLS